MFALVLLAIVPFIWFGMIVAMTFIEMPRKFRAPGMTHALGVGIGRLVFKALNLVEAALAALAQRTKALAATALQGPGSTPVKGKTGTLTHVACIGSEIFKVVALPIIGIHALPAVAA